MSIAAMAWARKQRTGSATRKAVLMALSDRHNIDTGRCHPSIPRIAEDTELSERTVSRALAELEEGGFIERIARKRSDGGSASSHYVLSMSSPPDTLTGGPPDTLSGLEPEEVLEPEEDQPLAAAPQERARNEIWDALTYVFGEAETRTAQTLRGKIVRSLKAARASPEDVIERARTWPQHFPDATLTETALEKHWTALGRKPLRAGR